MRMRFDRWSRLKTERAVKGFTQRSKAVKRSFVLGSSRSRKTGCFSGHKNLAICLISSIFMLGRNHWSTQPFDNMKTKKLSKLYILISVISCGVALGVFVYSEKIFAIIWSFTTITLIGLIILNKFRKTNNWRRGIRTVSFGLILLTTAFITNEAIIFSSIIKRNQIKNCLHSNWATDSTRLDWTSWDFNLRNSWKTKRTSVFVIKSWSRISKKRQKMGKR